VGNPTLSTTLTLRTDTNGIVHAYYKQPATGGVTSQINAVAEEYTELAVRALHSAYGLDAD
jgi:hypothetical protein